MRKQLLIFSIILLGLFLVSDFSHGQENGKQESRPENAVDEIMAPAEEDSSAEAMMGQAGGEETFEAEVIRILDRKEVKREDGSIVIQQNLLLKGLAGEWKDKELRFDGISDIEVASAAVYDAGDKVLVARSVDMEGNEKFYVIDFVRRGYLYLLGFIFALIIVAIGKQKGARSLLGLVVSFFIIIKFILPKILDGSNPLFVGLIGAFFILMIMIYLTEGWEQKSHLSVLSVLI